MTAIYSAKRALASSSSPMILAPSAASSSPALRCFACWASFFLASFASSVAAASLRSRAAIFFSISAIAALVLAASAVRASALAVAA